MATRGYCLFCVESVQPTNHLDTTKTFINFLQSYTQFDNLGNLLDELELTKIPPILVLDCCEKCQKNVDSFCEIYHKIKCLEIQLELKLDNLVKTIEQNDKSSNKWHNSAVLLKNSFYNDKESKDKCGKMIKKFRENIKIARQKLSESQQRALQAQNGKSRVTRTLPSAVPNMMQPNLSERSSRGSMETDECVGDQTKCNDDNSDPIENPEKRSDNSVSQAIPSTTTSSIQPKTERDDITDHEEHVEFPSYNNQSNDHEILMQPISTTAEVIEKQHDGLTSTENRCNNSGTPVIPPATSSSLQLKVEREQVSDIDSDENFDFSSNNQFPSSDGLRTNVNSCSETAEEIQVEITGNEDSNQLNCVKCGRLCVSKKALERHKLFKHTKRTLCCPHCKNKYHTEGELKRHVVTHLSPEHWKWECKLCQTKFALQGKLNKHLKTHARSRRSNSTQSHLIRDWLKASTADKELNNFKCDQCGKILNSEISFERHKANWSIHSAGQFSCQYCGEKYHDNDLLSAHMKTCKNRENKNWICSECDETFVSEYQLDEHMLIHTTE